MKNLNSLTRWYKQETLNDKEKQQLFRSVAHIRYPFPNKDYQGFVSASFKSVVSRLPARVLTSLIAMRAERTAPGVLILKNLPSDSIVPSTPVSGLRSEIQKSTYISESVLTGISMILGEPIGHVEEKEGSLVHDLIPVPNTDKPLSNEGYSQDFGLHVENAIFDVRERFIVLFGQRQDREKKAITPVLDIRSILTLFSSDELGELRKEQFVIRKPYILDRTSVQPYSSPIAILSGPADLPQVRATLYAGGTKSLSAKGQAVFEKFRTLANTSAIKLKVLPGQLVIINNFLALHGRTAFEVYGDGEDRYLMRSYVLESLWAVRDMQRTSTRILSRGRAAH